MRHQGTIYQTASQDGAWPEDNVFDSLFEGDDYDNGSDYRNGAGDNRASRPVPHFFHQPPADDGVEDPVELPSARSRLRDRLKASPMRASQPAPDSSPFEPPAWACQTHEREMPNKAKSIVVASLLTVACGVGLGVALLQFSSGGEPLRTAKPLLATTANVAATAADSAAPAEPQVAEVKVVEKPIAQRIAPAEAEPGKVAVAAQPDTANQVVVAKTSQKAVTTPVRAQPLLAGQLRARGDERVVLGDIVAARALYLKAATLGDMKSAAKLGQTYDPVVLSELGVVGLKPDRKMALHWYKLARRGGLTSAVKLGQVQAAGKSITD